jgi:hypothetical protein
LKKIGEDSRVLKLSKLTKLEVSEIEENELAWLRAKLKKRKSPSSTLKRFVGDSISARKDSSGNSKCMRFERKSVIDNCVKKTGVFKAINTS